MRSTTKGEMVGTRDNSDDGPDLTPDALAPRAGDAADAFPVTGILGDSPDADSVRLFLDLEFGTYYDIPREAIVQREKLPAERSPLGVDASLVRVRKGTPLAVHRVASRSIEHEFLAGDFTSPGTFLSHSLTGAAAGMRPMRIETYTMAGVVCCKDPTERCPMFVGQDWWETSPPRGCTRNRPHCID